MGAYSPDLAGIVIRCRQSFQLANEYERKRRCDVETPIKYPSDRMLPSFGRFRQFLHLGPRPQAILKGAGGADGQTRTIKQGKFSTTTLLVYYKY